MSKAWNETRVAAALGIEYPIIQGPFGGLSQNGLQRRSPTSVDSGRLGLTVLSRMRLNV